jgi:NAD(P)-dependent dehydrogenase (short-subunit alcohol dehydrogenase family)
MPAVPNAPSMARYDRKVAVITGAASGLGLATARRVIAEGGTVIGGDIAADGLDAVASELGERFVPQLADVAVEAEVKALVTTATERFGRLDAAFNVAGIADLALIVDLPVDRWNRVMEVTLRGVFLGIKHAAAAMIASGEGGAIVNIASINCRVPSAGLSSYATAKAGVEMLTRSAAVELGPHRIRVCAISPGLVDTPATAFFASGLPEVRDAFLRTIPMGRVGRPEDIAAAATFLASDDATWISGANLFVDGAESLTGYPDLIELVGGVPEEAVPR